MNRKIVTLCGSVRFKEDFEKWNAKFTLDGLIVLAPGCFDHAFLHQPENNGELKKDGLDELHRDKIAMSDWIFVINKDGYIGKSTQNEINYANSIHKMILCSEPEKAPYCDRCRGKHY